MVTIDLRNTTPEDLRLIKELKAQMVPDHIIQLGYNETLKKRENIENEKSIQETVHQTVHGGRVQPE